MSKSNEGIKIWDSVNGKLLASGLVCGKLSELYIDEKNNLVYILEDRLKVYDLNNLK